MKVFYILLFYYIYTISILPLNAQNIFTESITLSSTRTHTQFLICNNSYACSNCWKCYTCTKLNKCYWCPGEEICIDFDNITTCNRKVYEDNAQCSIINTDSNNIMWIMWIMWILAIILLSVSLVVLLVAIRQLANDTNNHKMGSI